MFRFSLRWILAAMVYAAIAAAAFSQETWVYADLLCGAVLLALGYAILLIIYARGPRQAAAAGFAVCTILLATSLQVAPASVPTQRILVAAGAGQSSPPSIAPPTYSPPTPSTTGSATFMSAGSVYPAPIANNPPAWSLVPSATLSFTAAPVYDITLKLRAANAVALMLVGLAGCLLGLIAYRRAGREF